MPTHIDTETRSGADLRKVGLHRYFEDPSTEILCASAQGAGLPILAHNCAFERIGLNLYGANIHPSEQVCTMARAAALSLPTSLDQCAAALDAPFQKDKEGHRLMLRMCKADYKPKPGEMERLQAYCDQDVRTEAALDKILIPLSEREQRVWVLDQIINDRGFAIDVAMVDAAQAAVLEAKRKADRKMWELTGGAVEKCSQTARIIAWLASRGIPAESIAEGEQDELHIKADVMGDGTAKEVLLLRAGASKTFKFPAMLDSVCKDGRIRGTLAYHGTLSGRWAGRLVQPQNMKRVGSEDDERTVADVVSILRQPMSPAGHAQAIDLLCGPPLEALSLCARACIVAPPGKKLIGGDFSNIEGRINPWFAGDEKELETFRAYDRGEGRDPYAVGAEELLGRPHKTPEERTIYGKVPRLACGYQGGVNAFNKMGANYGVRIENALARRIVLGWREANPAIVASWAELQESAIHACEARGAVVRCLSGRVAYRHDRGFLWCQLPSGRVIAYPGAIVERKKKVVEIDGEEIEFNNWGVSFWTQERGSFRKTDLYGGRQCAHIVSGTARDILVDAMFRIEEAGYPIVLTVHDEVLSEVDATFGSDRIYQELMEARETWFEGCPVTAKTWEGYRYEK